MPRMIFHVPNKIMPEMKSASHIRPLKMLEAFREIGYEVDYVMGDARTRAVQIKEIKDKISSGVVYDFMYSESSTMPTLLTESHHLPTHPFLDFGFFKFVKSAGIRIGLFYRDIYWKFPIYRESVSGFKYHLAVAMYKYDLRKYGEYLDILYLPSLRMAEYLPNELQKISEALPPGYPMTASKEKNINGIVMIYVGGIGGLYDLRKFVEIVNDLENIDFTICCRENEWNVYKDNYPKLNKNIRVVHLSGAELQKEMDKSNLGMLCLEPNEYRDFAVPYKLFEYIGNNLPILSSNGTATAEFVEENKIGFSVDYEENAIRKIFEEIELNPVILEEKIKRIDQIKVNHTWTARAEKVVNELKI